MYSCIGKKIDFQGRLIVCPNTSPTPTVPNRPEWGYLCTNCSSSPSRPRKVFQAPAIDLDKPNQTELYAEDLPAEDYERRMEELDDDFGDLQEIDL